MSEPLHIKEILPGVMADIKGRRQQQRRRRARTIEAMRAFFDTKREQQTIKMRSNHEQH